MCHVAELHRAGNYLKGTHDDKTAAVLRGWQPLTSPRKQGEVGSHR
jgi:hypothetical protein